MSLPFVTGARKVLRVCVWYCQKWGQEVKANQKEWLYFWSDGDFWGKLMEGNIEVQSVSEGAAKYWYNQGM